MLIFFVNVINVNFEISCKSAIWPLTTLYKPQKPIKSHKITVNKSLSPKPTQININGIVSSSFEDIEKNKFSNDVEFYVSSGFLRVDFCLFECWGYS